jgi:hypothetical protein
VRLLLAAHDAAGVHRALAGEVVGVGDLAVVVPALRAAALLAVGRAAGLPSRPSTTPSVWSNGSETTASSAPALLCSVLMGRTGRATRRAG